MSNKITCRAEFGSIPSFHQDPDEDHRNPKTGFHAYYCIAI